MNGLMNDFTYDLLKFPYKFHFPLKECVAYGGHTLFFSILCVLYRGNGCNHHTPRANTTMLFSEGFPVWISSYSMCPQISGKAVMSWGF